MSDVAACLSRGDSKRAIGPNERLLVVSQTCDVVVAKLSKEPCIEVLVARERLKINSTIANFNSTREFSFSLRESGQVLEVHAADRYWIPRELFDGRSPDVKRSLDERSANRVLMWLALRYSRPAWPDALVGRLNPVKKQLQQILTSVAHEIAEIRVAIAPNDEELPPEKAYRLCVYGVMDPRQYYDDAKSRERCTKAHSDLLTTLRQCEGILVEDDSELLAGDKFTWAMIQFSDLWNFANLTAADAD